MFTLHVRYFSKVIEYAWFHKTCDIKYTSHIFSHNSFDHLSTCLHLREEIKQEIQAKIKSNKKTTIPAVPGQREDISQNREAAAAAAAAAHKVTKVV